MSDIMTRNYISPSVEVLLLDESDIISTIFTRGDEETDTDLPCIDW